MRQKLAQKPLAFLDIETTGLNHVLYDLIEVAVIRTDHVAPYVTKIRPTLVMPPQSRACAVNGFNEHEWRDAPTWGDVAPRLHAELRGAVIVAHNLMGFDWVWLRHYFNTFNTAHANDDRIKTLTDLRGPFIDTIALAYTILVPRGLQKLSLAACCEFLDLEPEGTHRALGGAKRCKAIYDHMATIAGPR